MKKNISFSAIVASYIVKNFISFINDEEGQTSTEYILLVAVVAAVIFKFKEVLEDRLLGLVDVIFLNADEEFSKLD